MSEKSEEQISALMDGEVDVEARAFVLRRMSDGEESRARWARYHLIGETIRNNLPDVVDPAFAEQVRNAVSREVVPTTGLPVSHRHSYSRWRRPAIGAAVAASLAAVAVVGFHTGEEPNRRPAAAVAEFPSLASSTVAAVGLEDRMNQRLQPYVQVHNGHVTGGAMRGYLPYVRLVSHDASSR